MTITAHRAVPATSGIGPQDTLPCATKGASCVPQTIECTLYADPPRASDVTDLVTANADVRCSRSVTEIDLHEALLRSGVPVHTTGDTTHNDFQAASLLSTACLAGAYANTADALITFPAGYVLVGGSNPLRHTSASIQVGPFCLSGGGGGGGGGGCATAPPSMSAQPAMRHPDVIICP